MAISKKGNRNIVVDDIDFRWRATGNDDIITIVIWSASNENSRVVGRVGYHLELVEVSEGHYSSNSELIVTNRIIREIILHVGVQKILDNSGQLNIGDIEEIYEVKNAVRN